ncbi:MAG: hypothetical protein DRN90_06430 [Thermoproteota archaeon]|nr:MAG: hypothetical protein DRN90_06430 [Candidatus Korarchaeota archaeon]
MPRLKNPYRSGRRAERIVAERLSKKGWLIRLSKGSKGPWDIYALKSGRKMLIQVKKGSSTFSRKECRRLRREARKRGAIAALARYNRGKIIFRFV